jgi:hypothetical protein
MLKDLEVWSADPVIVVTVSQSAAQAKEIMLMFMNAIEMIVAKTIFLAFIFPLQQLLYKGFLKRFSPVLVVSIFCFN